MMIMMLSIFILLTLETGEAGSVVRVSAADLQNEPVKYVQRGDDNSWQTTMGTRPVNVS